MNLHEFQAKHLFSRFGIPVPRGYVVRSASEARKAAERLGGERWAVKAQVHAGGRGKGGGIKLAKSLDELTRCAESMLGTRLVTPQTGGGGLPVDALLIEEGLAITREIYLSALVDRMSNRVLLLASAAGGMDIEEVAAKHPEQILSARANPIVGLQSYQCRELAFGLGLEGKQVGQLVKIMLNLYRCFIDLDLSLIEINPLILTAQDELLALDAKINVDDNSVALGRQGEIADMRDTSQEDEAEIRAAEHGLSYITLDGNIGCMVNGAGLAMATMDVIKLYGGAPANFLDVGGGTNAERVAEAFKILCASPNVKAVLVNIFGGIVRCDMIAEGIIDAVKGIGVKVPVVVRLEGTNVERGKALLAESALDIIAASNLADGAERAVAAAGR
ncbi:MAG: ADP-forming succinate--CoA ligase subunit beta [Nitrococcus sp.]|nr:ADP-forming succinate--CoA ligase subunit beta [Nitrococcus sp.]